MRLSILAALLAATALVPGVAMAQRGSDGPRGARQNEDVGRPARIQAETRLDVEQQDRAGSPQRMDRGDRLNRGDDGQRAGRGGGRPEYVQPAPAPAPAPVVQADASRQQRGNWRGNDNRAGDRGAVPANRGGFDGRNGAQPNRGQWQGNDQRLGGDRQGGGRRGNEWRGNDRRGYDWGGNDSRNDARNTRRNWNRNWRQDNRYDWSRRRQINRNAFHLPRYYAPYGWNSGYRRFNIGFQLSSVLFAQNYWIDDADYYGLPEAYGPYRWVRYYNDALLVEIYSGQVVDTVYDIFW